MKTLILYKRSKHRIALEALGSGDSPMMSIGREFEDDEEVRIPYDENEKCWMCELPVGEASMGGVFICPSCDCGIPREGGAWGGTEHSKAWENYAKNREAYRARPGKLRLLWVEVSTPPHVSILSHTGVPTPPGAEKFTVRVLTAPNARVIVEHGGRVKPKPESDS